MFEQELLNEITDYFDVEGFNITIGFGEVPEETKTPYIVMYPLNNDGTRQVLCNTDNYTDGETTIQFSIYDVDYSNACYIGRQLDIFLAGLRYLPSHRILINNTETIRGFPDTNLGVSVETVTRRFTYTAHNEPYEQEALLSAGDKNLTVKAKL